MSLISIIVRLNDFASLANRLEGSLQDVMANGAMNVAAAADQKTPVDTGALRANKTIDVSSKGFTVTWNQDYAAYQEFGTSRGIAPQRFAAGAMDAVGPGIAQELAAVLGGL